MRAAIAGRSITLLKRAQQDSEGSPTLARVSATYYLDHALTKFSILPGPGTAIGPIPILVHSIQSIGPATEFKLLFDRADDVKALSEADKNRAIVLQYTAGESDRRSVFFLEESDAAKERLVQALTSLWLEKRNGHSMWF